MEIPNSMATPADGEYGGKCLEEYRRSARNVLWLTVREGRKFILKGLSEPLRSHPEEIMRLRKEYSLGLRINHSGVAGVYGFETHPAVGPVIVMEYVDGQTLGEWLNSSKRQMPDIRVAVARQIADALAYIHSLGLSHRDLKPDNILITRRGDAKIIDVGLGDSEDSVVCKQSLGTDAFGAPEQRQPSVADSRADVYSFGRILELLLPESEFRKLRAGCLRQNPNERVTMHGALDQLDMAMRPKKISIWRWFLIGFGILWALGLVFGIAEELYTGPWRSDYSSHDEDKADSNKAIVEVSRGGQEEAADMEKSAVAMTEKSSPGVEMAKQKKDSQDNTKKDSQDNTKKDSQDNTKKDSQDNTKKETEADYEAIYDRYIAEMNECIMKLGSACNADGEYVESIVFSRAIKTSDLAGRMVNELTAVNCPYDEMNRLSNMFIENMEKAVEKIDGRKLE